MRATRGQQGGDPRVRGWRRLGAHLAAAGVLSTILVGGAVAAAPPAAAACGAADAGATQKTCDLLAKLKGVATTGIKHRIISGQQVDVSDWAGGAVENVNAGWNDHITVLKQKTGWTPKIIGFEFSQVVRKADKPAKCQKSWDPTWSAAETDTFNATRQKAMVDKLKAHATAKGYVTVMWHANNPWNRCDSWNRDDIGTFTDVAKSGTTANTRFKAELDKIAVGLKQLSDAGIPVLFRPFHEMNGKWFWWGFRSPQHFNLLWNYTFNYLVKTKGLHNLLFVYSAAADPKADDESDGIRNTDAYYTNDQTYCSFDNCSSTYTLPGTAKRIDVLGIDAYSDTLTFGGYAKLANKGKPLGLSEYGPTSEGGNAAFDQLVVKKRVVTDAAYPRIVYAVAWHTAAGKKMALADTTNAKPYLTDGAVVVRESTF